VSAPLPRRPLSLPQRQALARYLVYFALPAASMLVAGVTFHGSLRLLAWLAVLAMLPALGLLSTSRSEPVALWVAQRVRRREVAQLEQIWQSPPRRRP
jgi:hypothetical protein